MAKGQIGPSCSSDVRPKFSAECCANEGLSINPRVEITTYVAMLDPQNAYSIISSYDIVLDCTDNLPSRYLLSDVTSALQKPLVSGAALKFDGQLCVYNLGEDGPCYRCLFPKPAPREGSGTCEGVGVLGVVTGIIGTLQATEAIKIITGLHGTPSSYHGTRLGSLHRKITDSRHSLLIYSALASPPFRSMKLRSKRLDCLACGVSDDADKKKILQTDYVAFCGGESEDWVTLGLRSIDTTHRISAVVGVRLRTRLPALINIYLTYRIYQRSFKALTK